MALLLIRAAAAASSEERGQQLRTLGFADARRHLDLVVQAAVADHVTHRAREEGVIAAIRTISESDYVTQPTRVLRIEEV